MNNVLVAVPYRTDTPRVFLDGTCARFARMTYPRREIALFPNDPAPCGQRYGGHARARNRLIEACLCEAHTHVLWMDVDLVKAPPNLIEALLAISEWDVVAPFVFVEMLDAKQSPSFNNGGWFYDTGGFLRGDEHAADYGNPFKGYKGGVIELDSVGCCYLIPADLYRRGIRYAPDGDEVEHVGLMRQVKQVGRRVLATDHLQVTHAYLPKYGVKWGQR